MRCILTTERVASMIWHSFDPQLLGKLLVASAEERRRQRLIAAEIRQGRNERPFTNRLVLGEAKDLEPSERCLTRPFASLRKTA